jgi:hypothetical protein
MNKEQLNAEANRIYDKYDDIFFSTGVSGLTSKGVDIIAAGSFLGQIRCGGLISYFDSSWGCLAPHVVPALRKMGLDEYAEITAEMFQRWATLDSTSNREEASDEIEEPFWLRYFQNPEGDSTVLDKPIVDYENQAATDE